MKINLLPWRSQQHQQQKKRFLLLVLIAVISMVIFTGLARHMISKKIAMQNNIILQLQNQLMQQEKNYKQKKILWQQQQQSQQNILALTTLENRQKHIGILFKILPGLLPQNIHLTKLELTPKTILLSGQTNNSLAITTLLSSLEKITWVATPQILASQSISNKTNITSFQIKADYKESL